MQCHILYNVADMHESGLYFGSKSNQEKFDVSEKIYIMDIPTNLVL